MDKKQLQRLVLLLLLGFVSNMVLAQVTIGCDEAPVQGALLQLKDGTTGDHGETATRGLILPCVKLQDYAMLQMSEVFDAELESKKTEHTGLVVYNVNQSFDKCNSSSIPSGFHIWSGEKWHGANVAEHFKPVAPDENKTPYVYLKQPNSFIVAGGSTGGVTIPIAKAFTVWNYWASAAGGKKLQKRNFSGPLTVKVEWQEGMGQTDDGILDATTPIVLSSTAISDSLSANITVKTTGKLGNAVVSLSDGTGVLWSWHIWVTAQNPTESPYTRSYNGLTWMDRNLGATSSDVSTDGTIGLLYQWGRSVPFPGYSKLAGNESRVTTITPLSISTTTPVSVLNDDGNSPAKTNSLLFAIENPQTFITNSNNSMDWYSTTVADWDTRWAEQTLDECENAFDISSITNPCPEGWKVPAGTNDNTVSPWSGLTKDNAKYYIGYTWDEDPTIAAGYYPNAGNRSNATGLLNRAGINGYCWSASPSTSISDKSHKAHSLNFSTTDLDSWGNDYRALGFSVRCVEGK